MNNRSIAIHDKFLKSILILNWPNTFFRPLLLKETQDAIEIESIRSEKVVCWLQRLKELVYTKPT